VSSLRYPIFVFFAVIRTGFGVYGWFAGGHRKNTDAATKPDALDEQSRERSGSFAPHLGELAESANHLTETALEFAFDRCVVLICEHSWVVFEPRGRKTSRIFQTKPVKPC
jgi:hypothetical protein